jgi:tetratricopeptide (TPR) repeat protein
VEGDTAAACSLHEEALSLYRQLAHWGGAAWTLCNLGRVAMLQGDYARARSLYAESLSVRMGFDDKWGIAPSLEGVAGALAGLAQLEKAARLFGAAEELRRTLRSPVLQEERELYDREVADLRAALGEGGFAAAWAEGRAMTLEHAVAEALEEKETPPS